MPKKKIHINKEMGHRITMARTHRKLSQTELAKIIPCSQSFLHEIEKHGMDFSVSLLKRIVEVLDVSYKYLYGEEELHIK